MVHFIVSFISKLFSCFRCFQSNRESEAPLNVDDNNKNNDNIYKNDDKSSDLIISTYINKYASTIDTDNFFCGSIPSSIVTLCNKYCYFGQSMRLQIDDYLNLETNKALKINEDSINKNKYIEYFSSDYQIKTGFIFRNIICVEMNKLNDGNIEYETDYYVQCVSLPKHIKNVTIDYDLSSIQFKQKWKNIVTMKVGDVVGAPSIIKNKKYFIKTKKLKTDHNINFVCDINILLKNGKY